MAKYLDDKGLKTFTTKMKGYADGKVNAVDGKVTSHIGNTQNPHGVTKEHVGLGNVTNDKQIPWNQRGTANGVATLGADGKLASTQMPATKTINGQPIFGSGDLTVSTSLYQIVDALPTKDIDITKIYLVPATTTADKNNKTEYIYIGDPSKAYDATKWEKLGEEQKNATIETPGGSIVVDTAFDTSSSNPIANKTVALRLNTIEDTLNGKVAQEEYNTNKADVNSKLKALEDNTITVDTELKDSVHPVQNKAVNSAVQELNEAISSKADTTALKSATDRITTLEKNGAISVTESGEGNGIASITKVGKNIVATKGTFVTSLVGYATTATMNAELAKKAEKEHTHPQYAMASALDNYALNSTLANYVTSTALTTELAGYATQKWVNGKNFATQGWIREQSFAKTSAIPTKVSDLDNDSGFLTSQSLAGYVNDVNVTEVTNGNGIASISKDGSSLKVTKATFLTEHQSLADYVKTTALESAIKKYVSQQGYLKKENLKETVTIKLVSINSESDTRLNGTTVTVKSGDTTVSTQTWQGTPIKVEVPCDKEVTIEAAAVKMYVKPQVLKYVPSPLYNREVTIMYTSYPTGVYIINTNNDLMDERSWDKNTQTTVGVALITDKVAIVIAAGSYGSQWSTAATLVDGVTTTTNKMVAKTDYKGKANTEAIVRALGQDALVAYYCSNYTFKNGMKGYLMAAGEAQEIYANIQKISALLGLISPDTNNLADNMRIYTSTQYNQFLIWSLSVDDLEYIHKLNNDGAIAVPIYSLYD